MALSVRGLGLERPANTPSAAALAWAAGESALLEEGVREVEGEAEGGVAAEGEVEAVAAEAVEAEAEEEAEAAAEAAAEAEVPSGAACAAAFACGCTVRGTSSSWAPLAVPTGVLSPRPSRGATSSPPPPLPFRAW